jgi:hypothetical protein
MTEQTHATRNGLFCALIFAACYWLTWPIAEMGFLDDFSYAKSAQVLARTGHLTYNAFAFPMLGWQAAWGALFIRLFGFSFSILKLATFFIALLTVFLFHSVLVRFGITARNAIFGTLTLGLSPLFLPLAASFMTDVYGLFAVLLCLYCCQRAMASQGTASTIAWLGLAAASGVVGGTGRQVVWLGALLMMPSAAWLLRNRRGVLLASFVLLSASLGCVLICIKWWARQPYSMGDTYSVSMLLKEAIHHIRPAAAKDLLGLALCLIALVYPVLAAWLPQMRKLSRRTLVLIVGLALVWTEIQWLLKWLPPWFVFLHEFADTGSVNIATDVQGPLLPFKAWLALSMLIAVTAMVLVFTLRGKPRDPVDNQGPATPSPTIWRELFWLCIPISLGYFGLLFLDANANLNIVDRYVLIVMPFAIICLLHLYQQSIATDLPRISSAILVVYAIFAIAGTHDWFASQRARMAAIDELRAAGVPSTGIAGGFQYDAWTQLEVVGHLNNRLITNPPGAYQANLETPPVAKGCEVAFPAITPAIRPHFAVDFARKPCMLPSKYPPVSFFAWLPPFQRMIEVNEIPWIKQ